MKKLSEILNVISFLEEDRGFEEVSFTLNSDGSGFFEGCYYPEEPKVLICSFDGLESLESYIAKIFREISKKLQA